MTSIAPTLSPALFDTTDRYDFVPPQPSSSHQRLHATRAYLLHRTTPTTQSLTSLPPTRPSAYTITSGSSSGLLHRHPPTLLIAELSPRSPPWFATVSFSRHGTGATISSTSAESFVQHLDLHGLAAREYFCEIDGEAHWWRRLGPSEVVLELASEGGERRALFVYGEAAERKSEGYENEREMGVGGKDVGEVHVMPGFECGPVVLRQVLCTAVVVVEREKSRSGHVGVVGRLGCSLRHVSLL